MTEIVFDHRNPNETSAFLTANGRTGVAILWATGDGDRWGWRIAGDVHSPMTEAETLASACEDAAVGLADLLRVARPLSYRRGVTVFIVPPVTRHHIRVETDGVPAPRSFPIPAQGAAMLHLGADGDPVRDDVVRLGKVRDWGGGTVIVYVDRDTEMYPETGTDVWCAAAAVTEHDPDSKPGVPGTVWWSGDGSVVFDPSTPDPDDGELQHWPGDGPDAWREPNETTIRTGHESVHLTGEEADRFAAGLCVGIDAGTGRRDVMAAASGLAHPPIIRGEAFCEPIPREPARWVRWVREARSAWRP